MTRRAFNNAKPGNGIVLSSDNGGLTGILRSWQYSTTITDADPGASNWRFNHADPESGDEIYVSDEDGQGAAMGGLLGALTVGTKLQIRSANAPSQFIIVSITSNSDNSGAGWHTLGYSVVGGTPNFQDAETLAVEIGFAGPTGPAGDLVDDTTPQLGGNLDPNGHRVSGAWLPATTVTYSVGSATYAWDDIHLGTGSIIRFGSDAARIIEDSGKINFGAIVDVGSASTIGVRFDGGANGNQFIVQGNSSAGNNLNAFNLYQGSTRTFLVQYDGDVQNANNSYGATSDVRAKTNLVEAKSQMADVMSYQLHNYLLTKGVGGDGKLKALEAPYAKHIGLVADEVEKVSPGLVGTSPEGVKSIKYSLVYLKMLGAFQEFVRLVNPRLKTLEDENADMKRRLDALERQSRG